MKINIENFLAIDSSLPKEGRHILCHQQADQIVIYQAYNHRIADYAIEKQALGGTYYNYHRMSWIKPNFLWMMYRCGWASKENQERVLAIWIDKSDFELILYQSVFSSFNQATYLTYEDWKQQLAQKEVRLQWDPDHDPFGTKLTRRAIQVGLKGDVLVKFGTQMIRMIEDISDFVREQKINLDSGCFDKLLVPVETIYEIEDAFLRDKIGAKQRI